MRRERGGERTRNEKTERVIISGRIKATNPDQVMSAHYLFHVRVARFMNVIKLYLEIKWPRLVRKRENDPLTDINSATRLFH